MAGGCAARGGCSSDYIAVAFAVLCFLLLLLRSILPLLVHNAIRINSRGVWIPAIQVFASFNLLLSITMSSRILPFEKTYWWQSCYIWAVWVVGPLGFGLLLSCRIAQTYQLYYVFAKARLPPFRSYVTLPLLLLPWIIVETCIQVRRPLNHQCNMGISWAVPYICLHAVYVVALILFTNAVRHIEFRFNELRDLWKGILVSATSIGIWVSAYILNEVYDDISWLQTASRFVLLVMASILVVVFFSMSSSQPLLSVISFRQTGPSEFESIGRVLGIPDSGLLQKEPNSSFDPSKPLDKLLLHRRFRRSFLEFAESCYAGECVHFYEEVHERGKISEQDPVRRIYMTRHIIEKYIVAGAEMELNISHRTRQEILNTSDLTHRDLFKNAVDEVIRLIKTNLMNDYWSSNFFIKFKEETGQGSNNGNEFGQITTSRNLSPSLSSVQSSDDALCQEHLPKSPGSTNLG